MKEIIVKNQNSQSQEQPISFEIVKGESQVVKVTHIVNGKKNVVFTYAISESDFDKLIPHEETYSKEIAKKI